MWGGGGAIKRGGGGVRECEVLPLRKEGAKKSFSHAEAGNNKFWGCFYAVA